MNTETIHARQRGMCMICGIRIWVGDAIKIREGMPFCLDCIRKDQEIIMGKTATTFADQLDCLHLEPVEEDGAILDYQCDINLDSGCAWEGCPCYEKKGAMPCQ